MHVCINCGSDKVERQGDDFTCRKCQFGWNVAFEQANKVYLRSQGRQPATALLSLEPSGAEGQNSSAPVEQGEPPTLTPPVVNEPAVVDKGDGSPETPTTPTKPSAKGKAGN